MELFLSHNQEDQQQGVMVIEKAGRPTIKLTPPSRSTVREMRKTGLLES
ncbi:hypothetical protein L13192_08287 [Pyrenophora tritici-repentis]|uniref:Uncharacterized protein n=1 Tax=Pyrenophora tritici-repentis TaxID=45151 RepID=A0A922N8J0_9PLEO|nr:hypothetical protein Ptr86124_009594 [Pyrenophora tritici-repentis]KAI1667578.1 hypothetical protein L13192_08287 [Pyrenophora tritici-repentis]KAI1679783.1 hypothetical protein KJE20_10423 [Pyrenophora tritici-repentis]